MKYFATFVVSMMLTAVAGADEKPLKVFILVGQSNMEGHAEIRTFEYLGDDPATAPLLKMIRGADGQPAMDAAHDEPVLPTAITITWAVQRPLP